MERLEYVGGDHARLEDVDGKLHELRPGQSIDAAKLSPAMVEALKGREDFKLTGQAKKRTAPACKRETDKE